MTYVQPLMMSIVPYISVSSVSSRPLNTSIVDPGHVIACTIARIFNFSLMPSAE